ncbi:MAG: alpha/beta hydrolase [Polyangiaceae bacterium]|nr:alpha/beta hydrolase [Polyangiaceae bacterium]
MRAQLVPRTLTTDDGATIAYYDTGGALPAIVLANGLGGPIAAWKHQIDYLSDRYRFISWDYRGLYSSPRPPGDKPALGIRTHARDLEAVLAVTGVERAALVGWSMGVQVLLELYEVHPERASHLVLINGTYGRPFTTVALPLIAGHIPQLVRRARSLKDLGKRLIKRASVQPETLPWLKRLGLVGATLDDEVFAEIAEQFANLDLTTYLTILEELGSHDASRVLDTVDVPALVIAGERDLFTPKQVAQQMARRIRGGEILIVRGASHYAAIEYPELVNLRIEKFLREHDYG